MEILFICILQTELDVPIEHRIVATTKVFISHGSTVATSTLESIPGTSSESTNDEMFRNHCFKKQLVVNSVDSCYNCGHR